jgi:IMP cyclohydrolase
MSCFLWEREFYEDGKQIADRIAELVPQVDPAKVAAIAIEAREEMNTRHVPLLLARELARTGYVGTADLIERIIQRPDELTEYLSIYWKDGKEKISAQSKKGLSRAFRKFDEYQLAK